MVQACFFVRGKEREEGATLYVPMMGKRRERNSMSQLVNLNQGARALTEKEKKGEAEEKTEEKKGEAEEKEGKEKRGEKKFRKIKNF
jgi:hypothetical protein